MSEELNDTQSCGMGEIKLSCPDNAADDLLKFENSDVCLEDILKRNGGRFKLSNMNILLDTSW